MPRKVTPKKVKPAESGLLENHLDALLSTVEKTTGIKIPVSARSKLLQQALEGAKEKLNATVVIAETRNAMEEALAKSERLLAEQDSK